MIKFFRQLRQRMIKDNRISKYLLYAIGEIVLVMIGILLALQVNTWNEARKQNIIHGTVMTRLSEEFRALEPVLAELVAFTHSSRESTALVVNALRMDEPPADEHAFRAALARANWVQNVPQMATSYKELVSTGRLSDIRNVELRKALIRYGDAHER
ncbi:MAG TPA: DUF6090 family protein, partial [Flavobacteriales bacterium]|nr:DUF6090 family protein [Flavobacteriales bacterium]